MENEKIEKMKEYLRLKRNQDENKYDKLLKKIYRDKSKGNKSNK